MQYSGSSLCIDDLSQYKIKNNFLSVKGSLVNINIEPCRNQNYCEEDPEVVKQKIGQILVAMTFVD